MRPEKFLEKFSENPSLRHQVQSLQAINRKLKARNEYLHSVTSSVDICKLSALYWDTFLWMTKNPDKLKEYEKEIEEFLGTQPEIDGDGAFAVELVKFFASKKFDELHCYAKASS